MVEVTYHCPYCGAVTGIERDEYLRDKCVTREPLEGWEYAGTTESIEEADGIEFVCLGTGDSHVDRTTDDRMDSTEQSSEKLSRASAHSPKGPGETSDHSGPNPSADGCGRTFYVSFLKYEDGEEIPHRQPAVDRPRFDFRR